MSDKKVNITVEVQIDKSTTQKIENLNKSIQNLTGGKKEKIVNINVDVTKALSSVKKLKDALNGIRSKKITVGVNTGNSINKIQTLKKSLDGLQSKTVELDVNTGNAESNISKVSNKMEELSDDSEEAARHVSKSFTTINRGTKQTSSNLSTTTNKMSKMAEEARKLSQGFLGATQSINKVSSGLKKMGNTGTGKLASEVGNLTSKFKGLTSTIINDLSEAVFNVQNFGKIAIQTFKALPPHIQATVAAIGAVTVAIGALVFAIKKMEQEILNRWKKIFAGFRDAINGIVKVTRSINRVLTIIKNTLNKVYSSVKSMMTKITNLVKKSLTKLIGIVKGLLTKMVRMIKSILSSVTGVIRQVFSLITRTVKGSFSGLSKIVAKATSGVVDVISNTLKGAIGVVRGAVSRLGHVIEDTLAASVNGVKKTLGNLTDIIKDAVSQEANIEIGANVNANVQGGGMSNGTASLLSAGMLASSLKNIVTATLPPELGAVTDNFASKLIEAGQKAIFFGKVALQAYVLIRSNWPKIVDTFKSIAEKASPIVGAAFKSMATHIQRILPDGIKSAIDILGNVVKTTGPIIKNGFTQIVSMIRAILPGGVKSASDLFINMTRNLVPIVTNGLVSVVNVIQKILPEGMRNAVRGLESFATYIIPIVQNGFSQVMQLMKAILPEGMKSALQSVERVVKIAAPIVKNGFIQIVQMVRNILPGGLQQIVSGLVSVVSQAIPIVQSGFKLIVTTANSIINGGMGSVMEIFVTMAKAVLPSIKSGFGQIMAKIGTMFRNGIVKMLNSSDPHVRKFGAALSLLASVATATVPLISHFKNSLMSVAKSIFALGKYIDISSAVRSFTKYLAASAEQASKLAKVLSPYLADKLKQQVALYNEDMRRKVLLIQLQTTILTILSPLRGILNSVLGLFRSFKGVFNFFLEQLLSIANYIGQPLYAVIKAISERISAIINGFTKAVDWVVNALRSIIGGFGSTFRVDLAKLSESVYKFLKSIHSIDVAIISLVKNILNVFGINTKNVNKVLNMLGKVMGHLVNMINPFVKGLSAMISGIAKFINIFTGPITSLLNSVLQSLAGVVGALAGKVANAINTFAEKVKSAWGAFKELPLVTGIVNGFKTAMEGAKKVFDGVKNAIKGFIDTLYNIINWALDKIPFAEQIQKPTWLKDNSSSSSGVSGSAANSGATRHYADMVVNRESYHTPEAMERDFTQLFKVKLPKLYEQYLQNSPQEFYKRLMTVYGMSADKATAASTLVEKYDSLVRPKSSAYGETVSSKTMTMDTFEKVSKTFEGSIQEFEQMARNTFKVDIAKVFERSLKFNSSKEVHDDLTSTYGMSSEKATKVVDALAEYKRIKEGRPASGAGGSADFKDLESVMKDLTAATKDIDLSDVEFKPVDFDSADFNLNMDDLNFDAMQSTIENAIASQAKKQDKPSSYGAPEFEMPDFKFKTEDWFKDVKPPTFEESQDSFKNFTQSFNEATDDLKGFGDEIFNFKDKVLEEFENFKFNIDDKNFDVNEESVQSEVKDAFKDFSSKLGSFEMPEFKMPDFKMPDLGEGGEDLGLGNIFDKVKEELEKTVDYSEQAAEEVQEPFTSESFASKIDFDNLFTDSFENIKNGIKDLGSTFETTIDKMKPIEEVDFGNMEFESVSFDGLNDKVEELSKSFDSLNIKSDQVTDSMEQIGDATQQIGEESSLKGALKSVDDVIMAYAEIEGQVNAVLHPIRTFKEELTKKIALRALDDIKAKTKVAADSFKQLRKSVDEFKNAAQGQEKVTAGLRVLSDGAKFAVNKLKVVLKANTVGKLIEKMKGPTEKATKELVDKVPGGKDNINLFKGALSKLGLLFGGAGLVSIIKDSTTQSMKYESALMQLNRRLGETASILTDFSVGEGLDLGLSKSNIVEYGNIFAVYVSQFQSNAEDAANTTRELLEAAAKTAQATGYDMTTVMDSFRSALTGSSEAVDQYGLNMKIANLEMTESFRQVANGVESWDKLTTTQQQQVIAMELVNQAQSNFGDGIRNTNSMMLKFQAVLSNLKLSLGNTFKAIWTAVLPALTALLQSLQVILDYIAQFTTSLLSLFDIEVSFDMSGTTTNTDDVANSMTSIGDEADNAANSAKELKGELAG